LSSRCIKSSATRTELQDLFSSILICELLNPSSRFWLISPWINDIEIIDNKYQALRPFFPDLHGSIRLTDIIGFVGRKGTKVRIVTISKVGGTELFLERLHKPTDSIEVRYDSKLHEKGLLTDKFYLYGSMNFTHYGININRESIVFETDPGKIAEQHYLFKIYWDSLEGGHK
jgi:phosphatidylserine/phosphatidylglycerophosphate/cardiolipin synthase-like enzyme